LKIVVVLVLVVVIETSTKDDNENDDEYKNRECNKVESGGAEEPRGVAACSRTGKNA
jgi:hypothetical protein